MVQWLNVPKKGNEEEEETATLLEKLKQSVNRANTNAAQGVQTFIQQKVDTKQIASNVLRVQCGSDMCLSKDIQLQKFECENLPSSDCHTVEKCQTIEVGGVTSCVDKCSKMPADLDTGCAEQDSHAKCSAYSTNDQCIWHAGSCIPVPYTKTDAATCGTMENCIMANITKFNVTTPTCITNFEETARRGCFGYCKTNATKEKYDCLKFQPKTKAPGETTKTCHEPGTRPVNTSNEREMHMCKTWVKDKKITLGMSQQLLEQYNCNGNDCPTVASVSDTAATAECSNKMCVNETESGYESTLSPVYDVDKNVVPCPKVDGKQYWPFSIRGKGYRFSQTDCDNVCEQHHNESACPEDCKWHTEKPPWSVFRKMMLAHGSGLKNAAGDTDTLLLKKDVNADIFSILDVTQDQAVMNADGLGFGYLNGGNELYIYQSSYNAPNFPWESFYDALKTRCSSELIFSPNTMLAGTEDTDGLCIIRNVNQSNQISQGQEVLSHTLSSVDLSAIRESMADIGNAVAQSGFSWKSRANVENLSRSIIQSAQNVRSGASSECGTSQSAKNTFMKTCRNMAQNGRALPCVVDGVNQENDLAQTSGACMQKAFVDSDVIAKAVKNVKQQSAAMMRGLVFPKLFTKVDLFDSDPEKFVNFVNLGLTLLLILLVIVGTCLVLFSTRSKAPARNILVVLSICTLIGGIAFAAVGYLFGGAEGILSTTKPSDGNQYDYKTFVGVHQIPEEYTEIKQGNVSEIIKLCNKDKNCVAWAFESNKEASFMGEGACDAETCIKENNCDTKCCPQGSIPIIADGELNTADASVCNDIASRNACKKQYVIKLSTEQTIEEGATIVQGSNIATAVEPATGSGGTTTCRVYAETPPVHGEAQLGSNSVIITSIKPQLCVWAGSSLDGTCYNSPSAWEEEQSDVKRPDRVWCMGCPERGRGTGYLYQTPLNTTNSQYYDENQNPKVSPLTNSELACMSLVKNTMGIKLESKTKEIWKQDSTKLFIGGSITVCTALALAVSAIILSALSSKTNKLKTTV